MADYRVNLDVFAGPLDLLLYLVRKEEVDIYDIHISKITDQYIRYIEMLKNLDIDLAGDFLVMAATLMQIKSAMLLPKAESDRFEEDDLSDPRRELIRQLLEYKKFKDAANLLNAAADEQKERFPRPDTIVQNLRTDNEPEFDIEQVSVWDLLEAFDLVCKSIGNVDDISRIRDDTPIDLYQIEILHHLQTDGPTTFERIFESRTNRAVMIGLFLALLELIREKLIWAEQAAGSAIFVRALTDEPAEKAVRKAIIAAEVDREERDTRPSIPIAELSGKSGTEAPIEADKAQERQAIPITELPPEEKPAITPKQQEEPLAKSPDESEHHAAR
ncbi:MAG: segregation/condensation protein A [Phycisphaerales bacterium]|nr:MAG: segregation/condensation protein A [Phycisphaerales bacterium]